MPELMRAYLLTNFEEPGKVSGYGLLPMFRVPNRSLQSFAFDVMFIIGYLSPCWWVHSGGVRSLDRSWN